MTDWDAHLTPEGAKLIDPHGNLTARLTPNQVRNLADKLDTAYNEGMGFEKVDTTIGELLYGDVIRGFDISVIVSYTGRNTRGEVMVWAVDTGLFASFHDPAMPIQVLRKIQ